MYLGICMPVWSRETESFIKIQIQNKIKTEHKIRKVIIRLQRRKNWNDHKIEQNNSPQNPLWDHSNFQLLAFLNLWELSDTTSFNLR